MKQKTTNIIILIVAVVVVGGIVYWNLSRNQEGGGLFSSPVNNNQTETNTNTSNVNQTTSSGGIFSKAAKTRDLKRISDIRQIQSALTVYFQEKAEYPGTLSELVPDYLGGIPANPTPGGANYTYTPIGTSPYKFYDLSYTLEVGVEDIEAGQRVATPGGIATF
jgi:hypothetical protein